LRAAPTPPCLHMRRASTPARRPANPILGEPMPPRPATAPRAKCRRRRHYSDGLSPDNLSQSALSAAI